MLDGARTVFAGAVATAVEVARSESAPVEVARSESAPVEVALGKRVHLDGRRFLCDDNRGGRVDAFLHHDTAGGMSELDDKTASTAGIVDGRPVKAPPLERGSCVDRYLIV